MDNEQWEPGKGGVTQYAVDHRIGNVTSVTFLVAKGATVSQGDGVATIVGSLGTVTVHAPAGGTVPDRNERLLDVPGNIKTDPYGTGTNGGWIVSISYPTNLPGNLLTAAQYDALH